MLIAFTALATFIFCVLFGLRRIVQIVTSIALAGILVVAGIGIMLVARRIFIDRHTGDLNAS